MMRITNSMMTANTKSNININKINEDRLNTMTASGQKITRPSDDPVVAIRAMRLNTSLSELNQYQGKNIPDADAWFTDTETALLQTDDVLSSIREKLNQASSQDNVSSNVKDILEELKQLKAQFYAIGNADSAGRTVFTGYRTGEMLTFMEQDKLEYNITENFTKDDLEVFDYIKGTKTVDKSGKALEGTSEVTGYGENSVELTKSYRIRLAYDDLKGYAKDYDNSGVKITTIGYKEGATSGTIDFEIVSIADKTPSEIDDIYSGASAKTVLIKETGEMILKEADYNTLIKADSISIDYSKEDWEKGDPRPEHYFKCNTPKVESDPRTYSATYDGDGGIEYNFNRVVSTTDPTQVTSGGVITGFKEQELSYEIAFNQTITINTHASDVYSHDIGRDIDELIKVTEQLSNAETKVSDVQKAIENEGDDTELAKLKDVLAAVTKERDLVKEKMHNMYTAAITSFKGYSDDVNKQVANLGALTARLEMTKNRVKDQQTNVKKLADENINIDLSETAIDFKNAQLALEAAQLAAGKISNQTLLNYI